MSEGTIQSPKVWTKIEKWEDKSFGTRAAKTVLTVGVNFYNAIKFNFNINKKVGFPSLGIVDLNYPVTVKGGTLSFESREAADEFLVEGLLIMNHIGSIFGGVEKYPGRVHRCNGEEFYKFLVERDEIDAVWQLQDKDAAEIEKMLSGGEEYKQAKQIVQAALKPWKVDGKSYAGFDFQV